MLSTYRNLGFIFLLMFPLIFAGFYTTYISQFPEFSPPIEGIVHFHALISFIWVSMLVAQPLLIRFRKYPLHRAIGKWSYIIFPLFIASFVPRIFFRLNSENTQGAFFPMADMVILITTFSLAMYYRRDTGKHMRYMIGNAIVFIMPTMGRFGMINLHIPEVLNQNILYGVIYLILGGLILLDHRNGYSYRPYLLMIVLWIVHQTAFNIVF